MNYSSYLSGPVSSELFQYLQYTVIDDGSSRRYPTEGSARKAAIAFIEKKNYWPRNDLEEVTIVVYGEYKFGDDYRWVTSVKRCNNFRNKAEYWSTISAQPDIKEYVKLLTLYRVFGISLTPKGKIDYSFKEKGDTGPRKKDLGTVGEFNYRGFTDNDLSSYRNSIKRFLPIAQSYLVDVAFRKLQTAQLFDLATVEGALETAILEINPDHIINSDTRFPVKIDEIRIFSDGYRTAPTPKPPLELYLPVMQFDINGVKYNTVDALRKYYELSMIPALNALTELAKQRNKLINPYVVLTDEEKTFIQNQKQNPMLTYDSSLSSSAGYPVFRDLSTNKIVNYRDILPEIVHKEELKDDMPFYEAAPMTINYFTRSIPLVNGDYVSNADIERSPDLIKYIDRSKPGGNYGGTGDDKFPWGLVIAGGAAAIYAATQVM